MKNKLFFGLLIIMACSNAKKVQKSPLELVPPLREVLGVEFDKQGHRGCRGLMPENTVAAMIHALGFGVTTLEMDVVITKDKQVVLSHEPWMNAWITTKPDGSFIKPAEAKQYNIYRMTFEEVKKYDVGLKPHPLFSGQMKRKAYKPLLQEVFDSVRQYMMMARRPPPFFNIEIKSLPAGDDVFHPKPAAFVELVMAVIKEKQMEDYAIIQSFDFRVLQYVHKKYPAIKTAMLIKNTDKRSVDVQIRDLGFTPTIYSPAYQQVNKKMIAKCRSLQIKIIPWTVNTKAEIEKLKQMGVDGIITDYPDLFF